MHLDPASLPLPLPADDADTPRRRHRINGFEPGRPARIRFRAVARTLQPDAPAPSLDAVMSAARALARQFPDAGRAPGIRLRLRCLAALRTMAAEPAWGLPAATRRRIALLGDYAANDAGLLPEAMPVVGGLDRAVLLDLAWPALRGDFDDYLDFRRLRAEEASLQGCRPRAIDFGREQWLLSRYAELALRAMSRRELRGFYRPAPAPPLFAIR